MDGRVLQQKSCPCPIMEVAMSQRYLSPSRVDGEQEKTKTKQEMKKTQGDKKISKRIALKLGCGREEKKGKMEAEFWLIELMRSCVTGHEGETLALVYAHVLSEVIVAAEVFPASLDRTLVR